MRLLIEIIVALVIAWLAFYLGFEDCITKLVDNDPDTIKKIDAARVILRAMDRR